MNAAQFEGGPGLSDSPGEGLASTAQGSSAGDIVANDQFRLLAENIPVLCWMANADGYIFWYNRRWHDHCGTTPEDMEGWGWQKVHDPEVLPEVMTRWQASIDDGAPFEMTFPLRGADGVFRPFLTRAEPVRDDAGNISRWFGVNTDISDQVAAEEALRAANERAKREAVERDAILGQLGEGVIVTDAAGSITFVNEAATRMHGVARLDVEPSDYSQEYGLFTEEGAPYPPHDLPLARAVMRGETVSDARWRIRRPDGTEVLANGNARPVHGEDDAPIGAVLTIRDETRRHAAEEALRASEATVRAFFDTADLYKAVVDLEGDDFRFILANGQMARFWGQETIDGQSAGDLTGGKLSADVIKTLRKAHRQGAPSTIEYPYRSRDGERWFMATLNPMPSGPAGHPRLSIASLDITARKVAEEALADALSVKDMLLHEVNHRVKNSLQIVTSLLMLQAGKAKTPELKQSLMEARARIGVVAAMHQRLYSTSQHDRVDIESYLRELAADTVSALDVDERIRLDLRSDGEVVLPLTQAVPLALIVNELLTNAVKYAFDDGQKGTITVAVRSDADEVSILIADSGRGLPEDFDMARSGGLGMRIVTALCRQARATLNLLPQNPGAGFELTFNRK